MCFVKEGGGRRKDRICRAECDMPHNSLAQDTCTQGPLLSVAMLVMACSDNMRAVDQSCFQVIKSCDRWSIRKQV